MNARNLEPTAILDYNSPPVRDFAKSIASADSAIALLRSAHESVSRAIRPIYTVKELQPVSVTIETGVGSCSQRLACVEALARSQGVATRVRSLWVRGSFWNKRFPLSRWFIPRRVLLAWPQFRIDGSWRGIEETFGRLEEMAEGAALFVNDSETLFEAIRTTAIDFEGRTRFCSTSCDLSKHVAEVGPTFDSRDELFRQLGTFETTWRGRVFEWLYADGVTAEAKGL